jgi:hypothetical protein
LFLIQQFIAEQFELLQFEQFQPVKHVQRNKRQRQFWIILFQFVQQQRFVSAV